MAVKEGICLGVSALGQLEQGLAHLRIGETAGNGSHALLCAITNRSGDTLRLPPAAAPGLLPAGGLLTPLYTTQYPHKTPLYSTLPLAMESI